MPSEIGEMTLPEALELFEYWREWPPEHELLAHIASAHGWEPSRDLTEEERRIEHLKSLERRWAAGAMNARDLFEATGGRAINQDGHAAGIAPKDFPGIGPFPGT